MAHPHAVRSDVLYPGILMVEGETWLHKLSSDLHVDTLPCVPWSTRKY